jgi:acyl-CoA oxidase
LKLFFRKPFNKIHFDISVLLSENDKIMSSRSVFVQLENDLGFRRSFSRFQTIKYLTVNYQANEIETKVTQISRWKSVKIIKKVKSIISQPEFAYETSTDTVIVRKSTTGVKSWRKRT